MIRTLLCATALVLASVAAATAHDTNSGENVKVVYDQPLPNVPGKSLKGVLVEYAPGGTSPAHTHPNSAFIYATVLEGAITSQVNNGPVTVYHAGENFSEYPGTIMPSAKMQARRNARACLPCSWSIPTKPI